MPGIRVREHNPLAIYGGVCCGYRHSHRPHPHCRRYKAARQPRPYFGAGRQPATGMKDRRGATSVTPRRLREERVLHSPAKI